MSLEDRIFFNFSEAVAVFIRMGFEFTEDKHLVRNDLEVVIKSIGRDIWRSSVLKRIDNANKYKTNA